VNCPFSFASSSTPFKGAIMHNELVLSIIDGFGEIHLSRPEKRNALNLSIRRAITDAVTQWAFNPQVHSVVITADGVDFMAGSDLADLKSWSPSDHQTLDTAGIWRALRSFPKPLIAAVQGRAWGGGCELALACDIIMADKTASFAQPEIKIGLLPGAGGIQKLFRRVGHAQGMRMVLSGEPIDAAEAIGLGLAIGAEDVRTEARAFARKIAKMPPLSVQKIKELSRLVDNMPLDLGLAVEREAFLVLCGSADKQEGIDAFFGKRQANFQGR
jgi:enoyl-CoA hydratase